ncbi:MAG: hypothetical protein VX519_04205 [Myxococcota bacterium]|nr:hypothetical protein [Myxococcota bacterium]
MKTQPATQLLQVPPALGSTGTQGQPAVGGFAEILQQETPTGALVTDLAIAGLGEQALDGTGAQAGSPNGWVVPNQVEPELPVLIAASEEGAVPVALATGVPRDALAYGGEPESNPSDLLQDQPSTLANALGQSVMGTLDADDELRNEVLLAAATQSVVMELNSTRLAGQNVPTDTSGELNPNWLDLASQNSSQSNSETGSNLQEAVLDAPTASNNPKDLNPTQPDLSLARDEVFTNAKLRQNVPKSEATFQRPSHEPAPRVHVREMPEIVSDVENQLATQAAANKPKPESLLRTDPKVRRNNDDKAQSDPDRFGLDQEPLEALPERTPVRLADRRNEDLESRLESVDHSRKSSRFMEEVEAEIELIDAGEMEVVTPETIVQRPNNIQLDVDVDEDLSVKIDANGQEVSVTLDGTNSALEDLKDVGRELADSLRRMGFDLSEFNTDERSNKDGNSKHDETGANRNLAHKAAQSAESRVKRGHRVDMTA